MVREQMERARELIKAKRYDEARAMLRAIDHPTAAKWLDKLDELDPPFAVDAPKKPKREVAPAPPPPVAAVSQVNVNVQTTATPVVIRDKGSDGPGCVVQLLWFFTLGGILSQAAIILGYFLIATVFLMPFGFMLLNKVPYLATLRSFSKEMDVTNKGGVIIVERSHRKQHPILLRLVYFVLIGFWLGAITLELAWFLTGTLLLAPVGLWLFKHSPAILTLRK